MRKGSRILVVEDEMVISIEISQTLKRLGYDVVGQAITGSDAVRLASELMPDLILMDIRLTGEMDGIEAASRIKELIERPIIFLSAHSDDITLERAIAISPSGYLIKPFKDRELYSAIELSLHKHDLLQRMRPDRSDAVPRISNLNQMPGISLVQIGLRGIINQVNRETCILFGASSSFICGTPITRWISGDSPVPLNTSEHILLPGNTLLHTEKGETIPVRLEIGFIASDDGFIQEYLIAISRITHLGEHQHNTSSHVCSDG
jgi:CheY-like chemotaxis protein